MTTNTSRRNALRRALAGGSALPALLLSAMIGFAAAPSPVLAQTDQPAAEEAQPAESGEGTVTVQPQPQGNANTRIGETFQDWQMVCQAVAEGQEICGAIQEVMNGEKLALWAAFGYFQQAEKPVLILRVPYDLTDPPTGLRVSQGIQVAVDGGGQVPIPFEVCAPGGCQIGVLMEDDFVAALKGGNKMNVTVPLSTGQTATINVSLQGFTAAFGALTKPE